MIPLVSATQKWRTGPLNVEGQNWLSGWVHVNVIAIIIKCVLIVIRLTREKMDPASILSVIHTVTIDTMLNFNIGNNGHG